jgi:hypothetical protein
MLRYCLDVAKRMLEAQDAFYPFGAVIDGDTKLHPVTVDPGEQKPTPTQVYDILESGMRRQFFQGEIEAAAIAADVTIPPELKPEYPNGIRVVVEGASTSRIVYLPYRKRDVVQIAEAPEGSPKYEYGEFLGVNSNRTIFVLPEQQ